MGERVLDEGNEGRAGRQISRGRQLPRRRGARVSLGMAVGLLASLLLVCAADAAAPTYNLQGTWTSGPLSGGVRQPANGTQAVTQMNMTTGAFSGHSEVDGDHFELAGTESGNAVEFTQTQIEPITGYVAHDKIPALSILPDGNVGGNGSFEAGEFWMEVTSSSTGPSPEEVAKKAKEEAEKSAKRPSATSVTCNYEFATSENTCVASVGDAGPGTPITPTGAVTFATTSGGFSGASCSVTPESTSPSIASCTLVYETANSGLPEITATYGGDARHTGSVGHTQFLGAGSEEGTAETLPGKPGEYPNEIELGLNVPTNGTTVEGVAQGANPDPAPLPLTLPSLTGLDAASAADLQLVETDLTKVDNTGAQNAADLKALDKSMEDLNQQTVAAKNTASTPAAQAEAQKLMQDTQKAEEDLAKIIQQKTELMKEVARNLGSVFIASRHKTAKKQKTRQVKALAYVVKPNVPAGKLKLVLKLNHAALNKLAGKRGSVSVYVRVNMILPSALYKGGLPRVFVQRITLKRAPGGKGHGHH
jgi:hypothetical protein